MVQARQRQARQRKRAKSSADGAYQGYERWDSAQARDPPPKPPPWRELPSCDVSEATHLCKPAFGVIGVQKSGTSTLYHILGMHPQVEVPAMKEFLWFKGGDRSIGCDPPERVPSSSQFAEYLRSFRRIPPGSEAITGEFSVAYLHCGCCPAAFKRLLPNVRLIAQLRDPIDRAKSRWAEQWDFGRRFDGFKSVFGSFDEYVDKKLPVLEGCLARATGSLSQSVRCAEEDNILGLSLYEDVIEAWLEHMDPKNLLITYLDQLSAEPEAVMLAIHAHLGLRNFTYPSHLLHKRYNPQGHYGWDNFAALQVSNSSASQRLYHFYRPHMQRLKTLADAGRITALPNSWVSRWSL